MSKIERMTFNPLSMAIQGYLFEPGFTFLEGRHGFIVSTLKWR
jgi:hypothetical protein